MDVLAWISFVAIAFPLIVNFIAIFAKKQADDIKGCVTRVIWLAPAAVFFILFLFVR